INLAKNFIRINAGLRQLFGTNAPDLCDISAMLRVSQIAHAGQLVALLAVLAPALAVGLAGDRAVSASFAAYAARRQHKVDRAEHVLHTMRVMLDAARM